MRSLCALVALSAACVEPGEISTGGAGDGRGFTKAAPAPGLPATIQTDFGVMDLEKEYLPGVVDCELGWYTAQAPALEAQAIAARTYLARFLSSAGDTATVPIGPQFQCWRSAVYQRSRDAVAATSGLVARYEGALIYANYDSGADRLYADCSPPPPVTFGYPYPTWGAMRAAYAAGARFSGYAWTQIFVTYNEGRSGAQVTATIQNSPTLQNRGALGQYAATCLSEKYGYDTKAILRFFYGSDLSIEGPEDAAEDEGDPADPCGGLDYLGECQGAVLRWCQDGVLREADCAATGQVCGWQDDTIGYNCLAATADPPAEPPPPGDACGGLTYQGTCEAGVIEWCETGAIQSFDCAAAGSGCGWQDDVIGYNCVAGCGELDYFGGCVGASLRWCEGGAVHVYDCSSQGLRCDWQDDTIGYNCVM